MKKRTLGICVFLVAAVVFAVCSGQFMKQGNGFSSVSNVFVTEANAEAPEVFEIREKMFLSQVNDIYLNTEDYLGKTVKYEGVYSSMVFEGNGQTYHFVSRNAPGCCPGEETMAGFEVEWDGEYPEENAWVEAVGVLSQYEENGNVYIQVKLSSLTVLETRGQELVTQ